ncbi:MAG: type II secretion system protein GspG, partial [Planctomycetota bacterium]
GGAVSPAEVLPTIRKAFHVSGLTSLGALAISSGWKDGDSFSLGSLGFAEGGPQGFFAHIGPAVDTGLLDYIPANATSFTLGAEDPQGSWKTFEELVDSITAMEVQPGTTLGDLWQQSGHPTYAWLAGNKRDRLMQGLKGFGPRSFSFSVTSGNSMGMGFGGGAGGSFLEVTDVAGVRSLFSELMPVIKEGLDSLPKTPFHLEVKKLSIREKDEQGNTITREGPEYYVLRFNAGILPPQMQPMMMLLGQIQPSFGVTGDGWLVSYISSATVRKYLRDGVKKQDRSIRTNEDVEAFLQHAPKDVQLLGWSDPRPGIQAAVSLGGSMLPMMAMGMEQQGVKLPFDLDRFPSPDAFVSNLRPTETFAAFRDDALVWESTGSFGLADVFSVGGAVASTVPFWMMAAKAKAKGHAPGLEAPAPAPPDEAAPAPEEESAPDANLAAARSELKRLETGILVFQLEVGRYPGNLAEIVRPGENYPHGYLPQPARGIVPDPWGRDYVYLPPSGNGSYLLYSLGPNGQDEGGKGDDVTP